MPFFKKSIKAKIKQLTTKKLLQQQSFYKQPIKIPPIKKIKELWIITRFTILWWYYYFKKKRAFKRYADTYEVEIINNRSLSNSLTVSKNSIKNLFDELLRERRGFKYIISVKITLKKRINDNEFDPRTLYFNSLVKTVINRRYHLID